jgi:hypothetical protein
MAPYRRIITSNEPRLPHSQAEGVKEGGKKKGFYGA